MEVYVTHSPILTITISVVTPENSVVLAKYSTESTIQWTEQCELRYEVHLKQFLFLLHAQNGTRTLLQISHIDLQSNLQSKTLL